MHLFVPGKDLRHLHTGRAVATAIRNFKCPSPRCGHGFGIYSHVHIVQDETGQRMLIHRDSSCVRGALAGGYQKIADNSLNLLLSTLGFPQQPSSRQAGQQEPEAVPAHGYGDGRSSRRFVQRNPLIVGHH